MNAVPRVLIVEDEQDLRSVYTDALAGEGYQLDTAVDGDEAVQKILQGNWDVILLDIVMPKKNGFDVLETVRRTIIDPAQKQQVMDSVIFMTNLDNMTDLTHALSLGPKEYVVKTQVTPGQVQGLIRSFLEKKQQLSYQNPAPSAPPAAYSLPTSPATPAVAPVVQQSTEPVIQQPQVPVSSPEISAAPAQPVSALSTNDAPLVQNAAQPISPAPAETQQIPTQLSGTNNETSAQ